MNEYIVANRNRRVEDVALELSRRPDLDAPFVLRQIEGWQRMRTKVPRWTEVEGIHFPPRLALEQCSGQPAAEYKAKVVERLLSVSECTSSDAVSISEPSPQSGGDGGGPRMADLTGGMGVDFSFIAPLFNTRAYVEQREELVEAARHNFPLLGLSDAHIIHGDGVEYLHSLPLTEGDNNALDLIFLDPARRDAHGGKTVLIEDCEPNVAELLPLLRANARYIMVKLSPMLDVHRAVATLHDVTPGCVREIHVFSSGGECKELLLVIAGETLRPQLEASAEPTSYCADEHTVFTFRQSDERAAVSPYTSLVEGYLYEPGPSIMKAGPYRSLAIHYGCTQLHPNSHLYVSDHEIADFPGRTFCIERTYTFGKSDLKALAADLKAESGADKSCSVKANIAVRNFPATVADLRKKLKIREGGTSYLFATTDAADHKLIIRCRKA